MSNVSNEHWQRAPRTRAGGGCGSAPSNAPWMSFVRSSTESVHALEDIVDLLGSPSDSRKVSSSYSSETMHAKFKFARSQAPAVGPAAYRTWSNSPVCGTRLEPGLAIIANAEAPRSKTHSPRRTSILQGRFKIQASTTPPQKVTAYRAERGSSSCSGPKLSGRSSPSVYSRTPPSESSRFPSSCSLSLRSWG